MRRLTQEECINKFISVHGDYYDYSLVDYKNMRTKVIIVDPKYGPFAQTPSKHILGRKGSILSALDKNDWLVRQFKEIHGDKYNYDFVDYTLMHTKVTINCPLHDTFEQRPYQHLAGNGCPQCKNEDTSDRMKENAPGWSYSHWESQALKSDNFDSFKVYLIRCWNDEEEFYKIGKTYRTISDRFACVTHMPYQYQVAGLSIDTAQHVSEYEQHLKTKNKENSYTPKIKFDGMHECFSQLL